jgi:glycosyltransferase involved in cell wall biosynthesis
MSQSPVISIIVPVYNTGKYVARCLESLINQTFHDIEIICVNDGSPDNAPLICESYAQKDDRIVLLSQTNQGLSAARNAGLLHARGKYIQFCDSDDFFDPAMCEKMYNIVSSTNVDIVVTNVNTICENIPAWCDKNYLKVPFLGISKITEETFHQINVFAWNKLYKKDLIKKFDITFPYGLHYEDISFFYKYLMVSKYIYCIDDPLYNYIYRADSIMAQTFKDKPDYAIDHIYVIRDVAHFIEIHGFKKKFERIFIWMVLTYTGLACMHGGEKVYSRAFETGVVLLKNVDFNAIITGTYNRDDIIRLYALKMNSPDMYFSVDRFNEENRLIREENQKLKEQLNSERESYERKLAIQTRIFDKRIKDGLLIPALRSFALFPWYLYKIFCMVYNLPLPVRSMPLLLRAYLFFPYYVLKTYLTLLMRKKDIVLSL